MVWGGLGGNLFMFRGESGRITALCTGADRCALEVKCALYLNFFYKGRQRVLYVRDYCELLPFLQ